jgi:gliding motility-associated-like protein
VPVIQLDCDPTYYKMQIFNRWGGEIFNSTKVNEGWNGEFENQLVPNGVYIWVLTMQQQYINDNVVFKKTGSVLILE